MILRAFRRISAYEVFREGAKSSARGGRAPQATSEFGLKSIALILKGVPFISGRGLDGGGFSVILAQVIN